MKKALTALAVLLIAWFAIEIVLVSCSRHSAPTTPVLTQKR